MIRHINIPIFIPHLGCPNQCVFCNQRSISGSLSFCRDDVEKEIEEVLSTAGDSECEIAFFGGSFTGIERGLMIDLLNTAQKYIDSGRVCGIRMSTRPDYINDEIITILKKYTISAVELGIQTMSSEVLRICRRGHTVEDSEKAVHLLKSNGFKVVGQMMIGLPGSSGEDEVRCAEEICRLGADGSRIYPTIVFHDTELARMLETGEYSPLSLVDAVERSKNALKVFLENDVECIRIGLCDSENLHSDKTYAAGVNHPSMGELVKSALYYDIICGKIDDYIALNGKIDGHNLEISCARGAVSQICGQKRENKIRIQNKYNVKNIKVIEKAGILRYNIILKIL